MKYAYFAGGCFWCITPIFRDTPGVKEVTSGYCGGTEASPTYAQVKSQLTGHRETIQILYDEKTISFDSLLETFLSVIDPFDDGGQFIDRGHSYTTAVYYSNDTEKKSAEAALRKLGTETGKITCVALEPLLTFWSAEEYHQNYDLKNPEAFREELLSSGRIK